MANKIYVGDTGTDIILNAGADISAASALQIKYIKPSAATGTWEADVSNVRFAKYTTEAGDLDEAGIWILHIYVVLPTWTGHGESCNMKVYNIGN